MPNEAKTPVDLAVWLGDRVVDCPSLPVRDIHLDSRRVGPGDVFIAVVGRSADGRSFIPQAVAQGACAVLLDAGGATPELRRLGVPLLEIAGLSSQLASLAARFYGLAAGGVALLGVTGTNGKTTVTHILAQLLNALGEPCGTIGTLGWGMGGTRHDTGMTTPDAVSSARILRRLAEAGAHFAAMEVSSHGLHQGRVAQLAFRAAVFTNLTRDHLDYHGTMVEYGAAKRSLFTRSMPLGVFNIDDDYGAQLFADHRLCQARLAYSLANPSADVYCRQLRYDADGASGWLVTPWGEAPLQCPLIGDFNVLNVLACVALLSGLDFQLQRVAGLLPTLKGVPGRVEVVHGGGPLVVVDYAHTPDALASVLRAVRRHTRGELRVVFGCGGDRDRGKRPLMGEVAAQLADRIVLTSDNPRSEPPDAIIADIAEGIGSRDGVTVEVDRAAAIRLALAEALPSDVVLIAGKGHEDYQEINGVRRPFNDAACVNRFYRNARQECS